MNARVPGPEVARLVGLTRRRQERAARELAAAREALAGFERVLAEHEALLEAMRTEIVALGATRPDGGSMPAETLLLEARRRRWLVFDLEKEEFYLDTMELDVEQARDRTNECLARWHSIGARLERLESLGGEATRRERVRDARRDEARLDERATGARSVISGPGRPLARRVGALGLGRGGGR